MKIALMGDVMLGRLVNQNLKNCEVTYPWGNTLSLIKKTDLRICNLECVISNQGRPWSKTPKMFHFRTDEKNVEVLKVADIDMVSIANNHVLDYEDVALSQMIKILDANKISHAGAGNHFMEAEKAAICSSGTEKIGMIALTDNEPGWEATSDKPGVYYVPINVKKKQAQHLLSQIQKIRHEVSLLIISAHWGPNWGYEPPPEQIPFAHALIDAGVDLIFGHSGHVFRGIEIYKNKPIIYCAGDFIDDYAVDEIERNDESFLFVIDTTASKIYLYPTIINQFQAQLATSVRKKSILNKMQKLCADLGTKMESFDNYGYIEINHCSTKNNY